jgi:hypothetical protein
MPFPDGDKYLRMPEDFPTSYMVWLNIEGLS